MRSLLIAPTAATCCVTLSLILLQFSLFSLGLVFNFLYVLLAYIAKEALNPILITTSLFVDVLTIVWRPLKHVHTPVTSFCRWEILVLYLMLTLASWSRSSAAARGTDARPPGRQATSVTWVCLSTNARARRRIISWSKHDTSYYTMSTSC